MGVPAFYRWLCEKYPKIVHEVLESRAQQIGGQTVPVNLCEPNPNGLEFDNLYVDMNGLIHPCSHPEDRDPPKTEAEMYCNVMKYVDRLFAAVRPRKLLFLAIDGVAPRAKMNQQRSRRFRAAQDAKEKHQMLQSVLNDIRDLGMTADSSEFQQSAAEWDSNVITPGTEFMYNLSIYMRFYILDRINKHPAWKNVQVILSDANEPGEGEHKIMNFIRSQRHQAGFDPNMKHVIHGLDADLIMLALATHEPYFYILRELVSFGGKHVSQGQQLLNSQQSEGNEKLTNQPNLGEDESWVHAKPLQLLHISILREYLLGEFSCLVGVIPFPFDFERVVDDFVFMCFFVGNDFLPHLPSLDIRDGAIDFLMECYKELLPSIGSYLTSPGGVVNLRAVDVLLARVSEVEEIVFQRRKEADDEQIRRRTEEPRVNRKPVAPQPLASVTAETVGNKESNQSAAVRLKESLLGKRRVEDDSVSTDDTTVEDADTVPVEDVKSEIKRRLKELESQVVDQCKARVSDTIRLHEQGWKARYYDDPPKKNDLLMGGGKQRMCETYVQGLCWVLKYYYEGCPSWNWYYPFHYAPFASDLVNIDQVVVAFELSQPFSPMEQLLAVLPAASAHALPPCLQGLMTDPDSPIIDLYTTDAPLDPNGKHLPWLWVLLLPFIEEHRITAAFMATKDNMSPEEQLRNKCGGSLTFLHEAHSIPRGFDGGFVYQPSKLGITESVSIDPVSGRGFNMTMLLPENAHFVALGAPLFPPSRPFGYFTPLDSNKVFVLAVQGPPSIPYRSSLLPGLIPPPSTLTQYDHIPRRPRLNKGRFNLLELCRGNIRPSESNQSLSGSFERDFNPRKVQRPSYDNARNSALNAGAQGNWTYRENFAPVNIAASQLQHGPGPSGVSAGGLTSSGVRFSFSSVQNQTARIPASSLPTMAAMRQQLALTLQQHQQQGLNRR